MALSKYQEILASHPDNLECLRNLVHMCSSLGRKEEEQGYRIRLTKAERCDSRNQKVERVDSTKLLVLTQIGKCGEAVDGSARTKGTYNYDPSEGMQIVPVSTTALAPSKDKLEEDDWELSDDLLPM